MVERFYESAAGCLESPTGEWVRYTDYVTLQARAEKAEAERDEALAKSAIDERQCDDMTAEAARLAQELSRAEAERDALREALDECAFLAGQAISTVENGGGDPLPALRGIAGTALAKLKESDHD